MTTQATQFLTIVTLLFVFVIKIKGDSISSIPSDEINKNSTNTSVVVEADRVDQVSPNCGATPWICSTGEFPPRALCCRNRCVDVTNDLNNCGFCGVICPLIGNWKCCNGVCTNINFNPFSCGDCGRTCPFGFPCIFGRCPFEPVTPPPLRPIEPVTPVTPPPLRPIEPVAPPPLLSPGLPEQNSPNIPNYQHKRPHPIMPTE